MKVLAGRRRDADDITYLVKHLGLASTADVLAICRPYSPTSPSLTGPGSFWTTSSTKASQRRPSFPPKSTAGTCEIR
jgi:hypothetical protein